MTNTQLQLFATVGVSTKNGDTVKFRFTNRGAETYSDILVKEGHTNVKFMDLPTPMSKPDAVAAFVAANPEFAELKVPGATVAKEPRVKKEKVAKEPKAKTERKAKKAALTPEQVAAAKAAAKRAKDATAKREKRAAAKAATAAAETAGTNLDDALAMLDAAMAEDANTETV